MRRLYGRVAGAKVKSTGKVVPRHAGSYQGLYLQHHPLQAQDYLDIVKFRPLSLKFMQRNNEI